MSFTPYLCWPVPKCNRILVNLLLNFGLQKGEKDDSRKGAKDAKFLKNNFLCELRVLAGNIFAFHEFN